MACTAITVTMETIEIRHDKHRNILYEHNKRRIECKECGGGSLCPHGRRGLTQKKVSVKLRPHHQKWTEKVH